MTEPMILYSNVLASGVTATNTAAGDYSVDYLYDLRPYTYWRAASFGTRYITMDAGAAVAVDSLAIYKHNLGTAAATVSLESSATGAWAGEQTERVAGFVPTTDFVIFKTFAQVSVRYWRIKIVTDAIAPEMAVAMIGAAMDFPVFPDSPFTPLSESVNATAETSKGGHLLGVTSYYSPISVDVGFTWPPMSFVDGDFKTFWDNHGRRLKPFFWVPNFSQWAGKIYFVRFPDNFTLAVPQSDTTNADTLRLKFQGVAE